MKKYEAIVSDMESRVISQVAFFVKVFGLVYGGFSSIVRISIIARMSQGVVNNNLQNRFSKI